MHHADLSTEDFQVNVVFNDIQIKKIVISHLFPASNWERAPPGPMDGTGGRTPFPAAAGWPLDMRKGPCGALRLVPVVGLEPTLL